MNLQEKAKYILRRHGLAPKKRFSQNFVVDSTLLKKMVSYANVTQKDIVLEIGPGLGFLTKLLAAKCKKVIAVEIDPAFTTILKREVTSLKNVELITGDVLRLIVPSFNIVVATPPYAISASIIFWLLNRKFDRAVLTFQKEFAERLVASVGSRDYGRLTVNAYRRAEIELLEIVPRETFYPQPKVDSAIVRLRSRIPPFKVNNEKIFSSLVRILFNQRNKKVKNAIVPFLDKYEIVTETIKLRSSLPFLDEKVHKLAPEDFGTLANVISEQTQLFSR